MTSYVVDWSCQSERTEDCPYYNDNAPQADMLVRIGDKAYCTQWWNTVPDIPSTLNASTLPLFKNLPRPEVVDPRPLTWNELLKIFEDAVSVQKL
jgi:hypothetical protein